MHPSMRQKFRAAFAPAQPRNGATVDTLAVVATATDWIAWRDEAQALLAGEERMRVERLRHGRDRDNRTIAYALHRLLLAELLGCEPSEVPLGRDERGCPDLVGLEIATSLSHGDDEIALATSRAGPVGIDIEPEARMHAMPDIRESMINEADVEASGTSDPRALLGLWTRKEAVLKASGFGLEIPMHAFAAPACVPMPLPGRVGRQVCVTPFSLPNRVIAVAHAPGTQPQLLELRTM